MANPNIAALTSVLATTDGTALTTTSATVIINNAAASDTVLQINAITVANVDGTNSADITVAWNDAAGGAGTNFPIVSDVSVPAGSTLVVISKETSIKLTENTSITATASAADDLTVVVSYDTITDV